MIRAGSRQGLACCADDRRPRRLRRDQAPAHRRSGGVPIARSQRLDVILEYCFAGTVHWDRLRVLVGRKHDDDTHP